ncbi:MAG: hypothetical protein J5675_00525 [Bacteroidales bacterium]|nr:hypothetical protein [Bacteroidales bacterium]
MRATVAYALLCASVLAGCGTQSKIDRVRSGGIAATLALSRGEIEDERRVIASKRDTLSVTDDDGRTILIMKAIRDDESGEMVATETLDAAVITSRFRNVAERHGLVDLKFEVIVPESMQDSKWQLRFYPDMFVLDDSLRLEPVIITGSDYRKAQLRGYQQYNRFISSIITDSTRLIDIRSLEIFIERNIPQIYKFKRDSSLVSDEVFTSFYGVTEREAVEHYTKKLAVRMNERRKNKKDKMYSRYVKVPIVSNGIRLDTVIRSDSGDFVYQYSQTIHTRPGLRKVDIVLSGDIYESDRKLYSMDRSAPLTFYISSLASFVDGRERYLNKVVERRAEANTACYVDFRTGKWDIDLGLGYNADEIGRIKGNILELLGNKTFDIDSIVIAASASPEGTVKANNRLAEKRAAAVAGYFQEFIGHYRDSVQRALDLETADAFTIDENGKVRKATAEKAPLPSIKFLSKSNGENWPMLSLLVDKDSTLSADNVRSYMTCLEIQDPDRRENTLKQQPYYRYLRENLYPRLRTVKFDFFLHRKGMVKDTIHTTELDTVYMAGVQALKDREYEKALSFLKEYRDYNTAVAFVSLDYNASAMAVLQEIERTPQVDYMMALIYARKGDDSKAVSHYLKACDAEPSLRFRGNLDPEIYVLKQRYGLNNQNQ